MLAASLVITATLVPKPAHGGAYESHPREKYGPRWSNDAHHEHGLIVRPDCVALPPGADAEYVPGRDSWGRPVIPAEPPKSFSESFPVGVDLDVNIGDKHIGGNLIELHAGRFTYDPATDQLALNGRVWQRDCLPSPK